MKAFAKLRQRINRRADGSRRGRNRRLGGVEVAGLLLLVAGIVLWLVHTALGIASWWAFLAGAIGLLLAKSGNADQDDAPDSSQHDSYLARTGYRLLQAAVGLVFVGMGLYVVIDGSTDALALVIAIVSVVLGGNALFAASRGRQSWLFAIGAIF